VLAASHKKLHAKFSSLQKYPKAKGNNKLCLNDTMHLWPKGEEKEMEMEKKLKSNTLPVKEKESLNLKADLQFLKSMLSDRVASYATRDKYNVLRLQMKAARETEEEIRKIRELERKGCPMHFKVS
jgi:hypothetical protein